MTLFFSFILATFVTMVLIPPIVRLAGRLHVADMPDERKVHTTPMPRLGGAAMAIGIVLPLLMWAPMQPRLGAFLIGIAIVLLFGVWDDVRQLDYRVKLLAQVAAVLVVVVYGGVVIRYLPFAGLDPIPAYIGIPLTVFALVGVTNAVNLADGLDGLAGGITLLSLAALAVLAYMTPEADFVLLAAVAVMGSILGFLRYNTHPARIFMGDGGSQLLGFCTGVLAVVLTQQSNTALSAALPLLILGLPILDTLLVMGERVSEGRSPFVADRRHIHHRLLALGFHHYEAVFAIYALQSMLIIAAYLLRFESDALVIGVYLLFCAWIVGFLKLAPLTDWRLHDRDQPTGSALIPVWVGWLRRDQRLLNIASYAAVAAVPAFFLLGTLLAASVPRDIGVLAVALLLVLLALYFKYRHRPFNIIERASAYVAGICVVYLVQLRPGAPGRMALYLAILFAAMSLAVVIGFRVGKERFRITPMDFLVVFIALAVPNLPGLNLKVEHLGLSVAMIIVLFYSIELVLNNLRRRWDVMRLTTYVTLAVLGLRAAIGT